MSQDALTREQIERWFEDHGIPRYEHCEVRDMALRSLAPQSAPSDPCRESLHVLMELETVRRRIEKGLASEEEKSYYAGNKTAAWIGAAVAFHGEMPQDGSLGPLSAVRVEVQGRVPVSVGSRMEVVPTEPILDKPAQVGNTRFGVGVKHSTVIGRAQREYEYQNTPENEAERMAKIKGFVDAINAPIPPLTELICPRCKVDRLTGACPEMRPGLCPMVGEAYDAPR